jgi:ferritin-like metal-binding protein YciE
MTDTARDAKLVQFLSEAYGKEKELETALQAHIGMTTRKPYKKRLQDHLRETKGHSRELERRIKKISGSGPSITATAPSQVAQVVGRAKALAEGPVDTLRGLGESEQMLKNAKKEYWNEHEEIAQYSAIETLAEAVGDKETAQLARSIRREEERMAKFLSGQITTLTKAVVTESIPASERRTSSGRKRASSSRKRASGSSKRTSSSSKRASSSSKRTTGSRKRSTGSSRRTASSRSTGSRSRSSSSGAKRASSSRSRSRSSGSSRSNNSGSTARRRRS